MKQRGVKSIIPIAEDNSINTTNTINPTNILSLELSDPWFLEPLFVELFISKIVATLKLEFLDDIEVTK